ncbi:MAG: TonB-dependent receptor [Rhizobacter sp.]|nr:TonB-dependent receptor [Burkholderiales bacterium]
MAALSPLAVQGQGQPAPAQVDKVIVTASPFADQDELQAVQPGVVVGKEALLRDRAASLGDTLTMQAGVQSSSFGPGASRPIIRGLDGPRVKTAENGVGTMDVGTISPDHAVTAETLGARQIEILRGPATLLYGSGAIGGLVNVVTDRIPQSHSDGLRLLSDARVSSAERTRDLGAQLRDSVGSIAFTGEYSDRRTSDYQTARYGTLSNSATATRNASVGASYILNNGFVGIGVNRFQSAYGIPSPDAVSINMKRDRAELLGELNDVIGLERIRFSAANNHYQHAELEPTGAVGTVFRNKSSSARFDLQTRPIAGWRTVLGANFEQGKFSAVGEETIVPQTDTKSQALFAVTERHLGPGRVEIGVRSENVRHTPGTNAALPERNFSLASGSIAYQYLLTSSSAITAGFSHAERAPAIEELYSKGAHIATLTYDLGNAQLAKERSQNFDLSYKLQSHAWSARASVYSNTIKNFIYGASVDQNHDGVADRVNAAGEMVTGAELLKREFKNVNARLNGAELSLAYTPTQGIGFTSMADTVRGSIACIECGNLPRMSPSRIGGKLTWRSGGWYADGGALHVFKQDRIAAFETATPGYTRIDASLRYRWAYSTNRNADFYLLGKNLSNRDMRVHTSFLKDFAPLPGRSVFVGVAATY